MSRLISFRLQRHFSPENCSVAPPEFFLTFHLLIWPSLFRAARAIIALSNLSGPCPFSFDSSSLVKKVTFFDIIRHNRR
jgi:hypothetical protein